MSRNFNKPTERDFQNLSSLTKRIAGEQIASEGGNRTTFSINGTAQYVASAYTVSDILQGAIGFTDPNATRIVLNQGLTEHLKNLYGLGADGLSTFSSAKLSPALTGSGSGSTGSTGGAGGAGGSSDPNAFDTAGSVRQDWVEKLPATHANGALLWETKGEGHAEMHLPTSENIEEDKKNHLQVEGLPPGRRHPWYMDRKDGGQGGETKIYSIDDDVETVLGESGSAKGEPGAFGILSPEDEQYYISMAWPYAGDVPPRFERANRPDVAEKARNLTRDDYRGRRILVFSVSTKKACVCTPGDWGPHPFYSNGTETRAYINGSYFGLSPDTQHVLGSPEKADCIIGFVPDGTPLGPYIPTSAATGLMSGGGTSALAATGPFSNTDAEMRYAGEKLLNHPNFQLKANVFINGFSIAGGSWRQYVTAVQQGDSNKGWLLPSLYNWLWYILEGGYLLADNGGDYVAKFISGTSKVSNHARGGAIDIAKIGNVDTTNGALISLGNGESSKPIANQLINFMASLQKTAWPKETGGPFETPRDSGYRVHKDKNPNHFHFGFGSEQAGQLINALKIPSSVQGIRRTI